MREQPQVSEEHPARASSKSLPRVKQLFMDYAADLGKIDGSRSNERTENFVKQVN